MAREFDAYFETFVADAPDKAGQYLWLVRVYSYAKEPGLIAVLRGAADSIVDAKLDAKAAGSVKLKEYPRSQV